MRFDVERFVRDLGGPARAATLAEVSRTTPYRWIKTGRIGSEPLSRVKKKRPDLVLDAYFAES